MNAVLRRLGRGARRIGRGLGRQLRTWPGVAGAVLVVAATVAVVVTWGTDDPPPAISDTTAGTSTGRVGVSDGDSVPAYIAAQQSELARLTGQAPDTAVYALVSFARYLTPAQVATASAGVTTVAGYARAPLPDQQTELVRLPASRVPDDLVTGIAEVGARKITQAARYRLHTGGDAAEVARYAFMAEIATREAGSYAATGGGCVYALIVRATPAELTTLAGRPDVRVVDAAPEVDDVAYGVFVAPLPEQVAAVRPLPDGAAP